LIGQICHGELGARGVREKPVMPVLRDWLTAEQFAVIDGYLPERLVMGNGRKSRLRYEAAIRAILQFCTFCLKIAEVGVGFALANFEAILASDKGVAAFEFEGESSFSRRMTWCAHGSDRTNMASSVNFGAGCAEIAFCPIPTGLENCFFPPL